MGRPPLTVGTYGKILFVAQPNGHIQARAKFRDYDGRIRLVSKLGKSRAAAERALKSELVSRQSPGGSGAITSSVRVEALADLWLSAPHDWSTGTQRIYRSVIRTQVKPAMGRLQVREVTAGAVSRALKVIADRSGASVAKSARACLSGMFGLAIEDGVVAVNPVGDFSARISVRGRAPRALTEDETVRLTDLLRTSDRAIELDLVDIVDWMLATGCRIGEALALRYGRNDDGMPLLDLAAKTWEVNATVVRIAGSGLAIQPRPKTKAGWRVVAIPGYAIRMLEHRAKPRVGSPGSVVFTPPFGGELRDPSNVSGDLRRLLDGFDCEKCASTGYQLNSDGSVVLGGNGRPVRCADGPWSWITSHTFRKTVATRLDQAGFTPRQVADQLGHANPSMTLDVYFGRQVVSAEAANVLDR